ncbi:MAG: glutathione S-transferase family protein [Myxococcaceae bacterium]
MLKLYVAPRTRSTRARWLLEEMEVPYEVAKLDLAAGQNRTPEYLALNPFGELPAFVDGELTLFDQAAVILHLLERFPEKGLAPSVGSPHRAQFLQWLLFAETRLEPLILDYYPGARKSGAPEGALSEALSVIDARIGTKHFIVGDSFTAADLVMASMLHLAHQLKQLDGYPRLYEYTHRHASRPAVRRALA